MKRPSMLALLAAIGAVSVASAQSSAFEVVWRTSLGPLSDDRSIYRASVCANGSSIVTNSSGEITLVDSRGQILVNRSKRAELAGAVASGCDEQDRLYISAAPGLIRVY